MSDLWSDVSERTSLLAGDDFSILSKRYSNQQSMDYQVNAAPGASMPSCSSDHTSDQQPRQQHEQQPKPRARRRRRSTLQPGSTKLLSDKYESLDYDTCENELFLKEELSQGYGAVVRKQMNRWFVMLLIGILTALVACLIDVSINGITRLKYRIVKSTLDVCVQDTSEGCLIKPFLLWISINAGLVFIASVLVAYGEPVAAGSGIPQIKCYLNGVLVPHVVRIKTLAAKVLGVVGSVSGGLAVGKEGPMIHSGAVIAAGISQGRSSTFRQDCRLFKAFRNDHEKRDFVSGGAAAGVAAAFGAPVGGVLFSLEEGASFWNQGLTWRIFFASMVSTCTLNVVLSYYHGQPGNLSYPGLLNFGKFEDMTYSQAEMLIFLLLAVIGGFSGALFNFINHRLSVFRMRNVYRRWTQVVEAMLVAAVSATAAFLLVYLTDDCQPLGKDPVKYPVQLYCNDGDYSAMASLFFQTPEESVRSLFHDPAGSFSPYTLLLFVLVYYLLACWTYGLSVPSGLFIPCLLTGAAWGRLVGITLKSFLPDADWVDPGKYALVGAAAQLGGVVRMTISLTVIMIEATGNIMFGLPLMIVLMVAKWVGDFFNEGLYDIHIQLQRVPLLAWEPPPLSTSMSACEVMTHPVITLNATEHVGHIQSILRSTTHNGFPVVTERESVSDLHDGGTDGEAAMTFGQFRGIILRSQLLVLLEHKVFNESHMLGQRMRKLETSNFRAFYPHGASLSHINISPVEESFTINLLPYINPAPYTVSSSASLPKIFRLFRALGLRHLVVTNDTNQVMGIVTRKDLAKFRVWNHRGQIGLEELQISQG